MNNYSPVANRFVGDAEPYGFIVNLCVFKIIYHIGLLINPPSFASQNPPPFQRRLTEQQPIAWAPLAKKPPEGAKRIICIITRHSRERRPRRSVGFDRFHGQPQDYELFSICSGRCPHRPNKIYFIIRPWRIGSSGAPNPTDLS